jgi:serine/threonine protein kinase
LGTQNNEAELNIPTELQERYVDFKYVGEGGMGRIISALDKVLDKRVAFKLLPPMAASDAAVIRFQQEAKAVSKLNHQNIVKVLDFGFASTGEPYLIMEYVSGETLDAVIKKMKSVPLRTAIEIASQVCDGLQHAHSNKIIHRDLKPGNVMLDENKVVKILDFGVAKILDQENVDWRLTKPGHAIGSPNYMSPEQLRGEDVDERADVYSLGLLICKMVTGRVPFENENIMSILVGRLEKPLPVIPISERNPILSAALSKIVMETLQPDRDDRMASMSALKNALVETESIVEKGEEPREAESAFYQSKWATGALLGVVVLMLMIGVVSLIPNLNYTITSKDDITHDGEGSTQSKSKQAQEDKRPKRDSYGVIPYGFERRGDEGYLLARTSLEDEDLKRLRGTGAKCLSFQNNPNITVEGIKNLVDLPVERLCLRDTRLGNEVIPYINQFSQLEYLDLRRTSIDDDAITQLRPSTRLNFLALGQVSGISDASMPVIVRKFPNLKELHLSATSVTAEGLKKLMPLKLDHLIVSSLSLRDRDMDILVKLHPPFITMEGNPITDAGVEKLKQIDDLRGLNVQFCTLLSEAKVRTLKDKYKDIRIEGPSLPKTNGNLTGVEDLLGVPESVEDEK